MHANRTFRSAFFAALLLLPAGALAATPNLVVLDVSDAAGKGSGARIRAEIVEALQAKGEIHVVKLDAWKAAAKKKGVKGKAVMSAAAIAKVAPGAKVDGVVIASVVKKGRGFDCVAKLYGKNGRPLASKSVPVTAKSIGAGGADRIAAAVGAAMGTGGGEPEVPPPSRTAPEPPPEPTPTAKVEPTPGTKPPADSFEAEESRREKRAPASGEGEKTGGRLAAKSGEDDERPRKRSDEDGEVKKSVEGEEDGLPPWVSIQVGVPVMWRSYNLQPDSGVPVEYRTDTPYGGVAADLEAFPLRGMGPAIRGIGLAGHFSRGFLKSRYTDPATLKLVDFGSAEYRYYGDLLYRYGIKPESPYNTVVGVRVGYGFHRFAVDQNPVLNESSRKGLRAGAEVFQPLLPPYFGVHVGGMFFPGAGPGDTEKAAYGADATGFGFELQAGVGGELRPILKGLTWTLGFDLVRFSDKYAGAGKSTTGGTASESYTGVLAGVAYAL